MFYACGVSRSVQLLCTLLPCKQPSRSRLMQASPRSAGNLVALLAEEEGGLGKALGRQLLRTRRNFTATVFSPDGAWVHHRRSGWLLRGEAAAWGHCTPVAGPCAACCRCSCLRVSFLTCCYGMPATQPHTSRLPASVQPTQLDPTCTTCHLCRPGHLPHAAPHLPHQQQHLH